MVKKNIMRELGSEYSCERLWACKINIKSFTIFRLATLHRVILLFQAHLKAPQYQPHSQLSHYQKHHKKMM